MLVRNNTTEIRNIGYQVRPADPTERRPPELGHIRLIPGNNDVPPDLWKKVEKHPVVLGMMEEEAESGKPMLEVDAKLDLQSISKLSERQALSIVKGTFDRGLLRQWQRVERRRKVAELLEKQLRKVEPGAKQAETTADEDEAPAAEA